MKTIAIITARGGSKRIPKKNIKLFADVPIIAYSILCAKNSGLFDTIMVSTDNQEIADVAKEYGAEVPFLRSAANADDYATTADVLLEVLDDYKKRNQTYQYACCIYPTAPFVTAKNLQEAMNMLIGKDIKCIIPVVKFSYPPQRCFVVQNDCLRYLHPENVRKRSQDLEPLYHDAGQFYFFEVPAFLKAESLVMEQTMPLFISQLQAQDIDSIDDWQFAELKYQFLQKKDDV